MTSAGLTHLLASFAAQGSSSINVSDLILEVIPEFDFYGITIVTKVQWDNILTKSQSDGCTCKEIIAEAVPWAAKCFETNDVFTIIGM